MAFPNIDISSTPTTILGRHFQPSGRLNVKQSPYLAKGDGRCLYDVAVTASNATISSVTGFVGAEIGMHVWIRWGGTGTGNNRRCFLSTIIGVGAGPVPSTITLANAPASNVTGAYVFYGTNDAPAIRQCMSDAVLNNQEVFIPAGQYCLASSRVTNDGFGNPNAMLPIPLLSDFKKRGFLVVHGEGITNPQTVWIAIDETRPTNGTWLVDLQEGTGTMPCVIGASATGQAQAMAAAFFNIQIAVRPNPNGAGINTSGILGFHIGSIILDKCTYLGDSSIHKMSDITNPNTTVGFTSVQNAREIMSHFSDNQVWNADTGYSLQEHVVCSGQTVANACKRGYNLGAGNQAWYGGRICGHWNEVHIAVQNDNRYGQTFGLNWFNIEQLNIEDRDPSLYGENNNIQHVTDFYDATNLARGTVRIHQSSSPFPLTIVGGSNVKMYDINDNVIVH